MTQAIRRTDLLEALDIAEMSIAPGSMIPIMRHFWFTGTHIVTYDDRTGVSLPFPSDFKGAVPSVLLDIVKNSKAREIKIGVPENGHLPVTMGRTKASFPFMMQDSFVFDMPKFKIKPLDAEQDKKSKVAERALIAGIEDCLYCIDEKSPTPDHMGVTLDPGGMLYATNSRVLAAVRVPVSDLQTNLPSRPIILSAPFCRQFVKLGKDQDHRFRIKFTDDSVVVRTGTNIMLFGRLLRSDRPIAFAEFVIRAAPNFDDAHLHVLPTDKYALLIERAHVIADSARAPAKTHVTISEGRATFETKSDERGVVRDEIVIEGQRDTAMTIDPAWLRKIGGDVAEIRFYKKAVQLRRGKSNFLIGASA